MHRTRWRAAVPAAALLLLLWFLSFASSAWAHAVCGNRVFPATLTMDDPGVNDELSFPTIQYLPMPAADGNPSGHSVDYGFEWDKRITRDLGFGINDDYFTKRGAGQNLNGWDNVTLTLKDQLPCDANHEFLVSIGVVHEFAGSGSAQLSRAGAIDTVGNTTPTVYVGKGLGDLPIGFFRPLAVTGEFGYQISDSPSVSPNQWDYATSLQYSMPYLQQHVRALNIPDFFTRLVPVVEVALSTPSSGLTTGTIAPGVFYEANKWQVGIEAVIPANAATRQLQGTGFIAQFHVFLDDVLPSSLGRPLIDRDLWQW
jgi:hypothetical protein